MRPSELVFHLEQVPSEFRTLADVVLLSVVGAYVLEPDLQYSLGEAGLFRQK